MKPPKLIGFFQVKFPGWGRDKEPHFHDEWRLDDQNRPISTGEKQKIPCDMAFHPPNGPCMSCRFNPVGACAVDEEGTAWLLVNDYGVKRDGPLKDLRWVRFPIEVAE